MYCSKCCPSCVGITIGFEREVVSTVEGSSDDIVVKVIKVGSTDKPVSVAFTTEDGTAESGVDYEPLHGVLIFSATETEKEIVVSVADDGLVEGQEHFFVVMSLPMSDENGVALNRERVRADIEDDDSKHPLKQLTNFKSPFCVSVEISNSLSVFQWCLLSLKLGPMY